MSSLASRRQERASRRMLYLKGEYIKYFPNAQLPLDPGLVAEWAYSTDR